MVAIPVESVAMKRSITSTFKPAWWLPSPHLQTLWPTFFRQRPQLSLKSERVELSDGDFIDLSWYPRPNSPIVLFIHGLEGNLNSHYARSSLKALHNAGFSAVFMHLRGCSKEVNRLPSSYHSGRTADLQAVLNHLQDTHRPPSAAIGISLGGNLLLKYLGETGHLSGLNAAIAVSIPFQLQDCATKLEQGFSRIYGCYLLNKLKTSFRRKFKQLENPLDINLQNIKTLYQFDDAITAPLNAFKDAPDYYQQNSSGQFLRDIQTPTLIIHAKDDPFMQATTVPTEDMLSDSITLELTEHGGHVGFVSGNAPWLTEYWLERRMISWLQEKAYTYS